MKGMGYVGYGEVSHEAVPITNFVVESAGKHLLELSLRAPNAGENEDDPANSEWAVGIRWIKSVTRDEAKSFKGIFANQHIVCKLRDPDTLEFLQSHFGGE